MPHELLSAAIRVAPFLILLSVITVRIRQGHLTRAALSLQPPISMRWMTAWLILFILFALAIEFTIYRLGLLSVGAFPHHGLSAAIRIVGMVILAPVAEELLFRGLLLNWLSKKLPNVHMAIVIQAVMFVAVHGFAYDLTVTTGIGSVQTLCDAMLFAYARRHTQSLYTPMLMHASGNAIAVLEMVMG